MGYREVVYQYKGGDYMFNIHNFDREITTMNSIITANPECYVIMELD